MPDIDLDHLERLARAAIHERRIGATRFARMDVEAACSNEVVLALVARLRAAETELARPQQEHLAIVHHPERCAGNPTVGHTRICVHSIVSYLGLVGGDIERLLADYPNWTQEQVEAAVAYYEGHREEIDGIIQRQREAYEQGLAEQEERRAGEQP